jgi:hypothetical protein
MISVREDMVITVNYRYKWVKVFVVLVVIVMIELGILCIMVV